MQVVLLLVGTTGGGTTTGGLVGAGAGTGAIVLFFLVPTFTMPLITLKFIIINNLGIN